MRVTNNMMLGKTIGNINSNKSNLNYLNNQMTTQKKISRPSEDPVVAIRALRLRSSLSEIDQYYDNNIPDAESWLEVTETALKNMNKILTDIRSECVSGANDSLTADDRSTIYKQLQALREQIYSEGNSDYAGRTVFTGYRTNSTLTFMENKEDVTYTINQPFSYEDIEEYRYYSGEVTIPTNAAELAATVADDIPQTDVTTFDRIRLSYDEISGGLTDADGNALASPATLSYKQSDGTNVNYNVTVYETREEWEAASATATGNTNGDALYIEAGEAVFIKETGELVLSQDLSSAMKGSYASLDLTYTKTGFNNGEPRPEYYFNCTYRSTDGTTTDYRKYELNDDGTYKLDAKGQRIEVNQDINYIIATNQTLTVNTNASDVFDANIGRDVDELLNAVEKAIAANDKVSEIKSMMAEEQYSDDESQANLQLWLDAAQREADYADDNMQKLYDKYIGKFDGYMAQVNLALTNNGCKGDRLDLTKNRVENQQTTLEELKSTNEDRELSDIIIDYTAAYSAYDASLQAASYLNKTTLLNYI
ncbi:MAG: flagellar hook-associated protein FlgL [Roseburia sp.]